MEGGINISLARMTYICIQNFVAETQGDIFSARARSSWQDIKMDFREVGLKLWTGAYSSRPRYSLHHNEPYAEKDREQWN
jgi:hypothetical protein